MTNKQDFREVREKHFKTLEQFVPIVAESMGKPIGIFRSAKVFTVLAKNQGCRFRGA